MARVMLWCARMRAEPSQVGRDELRGLAALQHAVQTRAPLFRRYALGLRVEPLSERAAYALWSAGCEGQIFCPLESSS